MNNAQSIERNDRSKWYWQSTTRTHTYAWIPTHPHHPKSIQMCANMVPIVLLILIFLLQWSHTYMHACVCLCCRFFFSSFFLVQVYVKSTNTWLCTVNDDGTSATYTQMHAYNFTLGVCVCLHICVFLLLFFYFMNTTTPTPTATALAQCMYTYMYHTQREKKVILLLDHCMWCVAVLLLLLLLFVALTVTAYRHHRISSIDISAILTRTLQHNL